MFKKKKAKELEIQEAASVSELGLDFSESSEEEADPTDEGGAAAAKSRVPRESVAETPALWSGHLAFCGALPISTWPSGNPQRKGPLTARCAFQNPTLPVSPCVRCGLQHCSACNRGATRWFVITNAAVKVYKNSAMDGKPQMFELAGGSIFLASNQTRDCYLRLPSAEEGMVLYFRPIKREQTVLSATEKKAMMEAAAANLKAREAANDLYPGLPSMDGFGRNKQHKDYGKGDETIEADVKKIQRARMAGGNAEPAPEPAPEPTAEEGQPPEATDLDWASMVEMTFVLANQSVAVVQPEEESNPLLADFEPEEVKYTHHAPKPDTSDSDSSDEDEPVDRGPQIRLIRAFPGSRALSFITVQTNRQYTDVLSQQRDLMAQSLQSTDPWQQSAREWCAII